MKYDRTEHTRNLYQPNWQFNVIYLIFIFLKFPKNRRQRIHAIKHSRWGDNIDDTQVLKLLHETTAASIISLEIVRGKNSLRRLCGNPFFIMRNVFIQFRGETFLNQLNLYQNGKNIINRFFRLNLKLWELGVFENTFDFLRNCGCLKNGEDFFIDLGNFSEDIEEAILVLKQKRWKNRLDYLSLSYEDKSYFDSLADTYFTIESLKSKWSIRK